MTESSYVSLVGIHLVELSAVQGEWSQETFGPDSERGPLGALRHLEKEAREAQQAWSDYVDRSLKADAADGTGLGPFPPTKGDVLKELADVLILLLDARRRAGFTVLDVIKAAQSKMIENKARTWPKYEPWTFSPPYEADGNIISPPCWLVDACKGGVVQFDIAAASPEKAMEIARTEAKRRDEYPVEHIKEAKE